MCVPAKRSVLARRLMRSWREVVSLTAATEAELKAEKAAEELGEEEKIRPLAID